MQALITGPIDARHTVILAHGASQAMDHEAMNALADGLNDAGLRVARFEFPYMHRRRSNGRGGAPDRQPVLEQTWREVIARVRVAVGGDVAIGGRSLGGRIASLVADDCAVQALICYAYPFHPAGRPETLRTAHLETLRTPTLILQGERDPFRQPRRRGRLRPVAGDHRALDRRRRPRLHAAQALRPHPGTEHRRGRTADHSIPRPIAR